MDRGRLSSIVGGRSTKTKEDGKFILVVGAPRACLERGSWYGDREGYHDAATEREALGGQLLGGSAEEGNR